MRMPRWLRPRAQQAVPDDPVVRQPRYRPAQHVVVRVVLALETPASADAIAAAIDVERGLAADAPAAGRTSADAVREVLRRMASDGRVTAMRPFQWHDHRVRVPGRWDNTDWWWPTHKWDELRNARSRRRSSGPTFGAPASDRRRQPPEKSDVAKAVDRVIAANDAHYQAHKNDFGSSGY